MKRTEWHQGNNVATDVFKSASALRTEQQLIDPLYSWKLCWIIQNKFLFSTENIIHVVERILFSLSTLLLRISDLASEQKYNYQLFTDIKPPKLLKAKVQTYKMWLRQL